MKKTILLATAVLTGLAAMADPYTRLFKVVNPAGDCQVMKPGAAAFEAAERGKAYPFGTKVECGKDSSAILLFSEGNAVQLRADSAALVELNEETDSRIVKLFNGTAITRIAAGTAQDYIIIETPAGAARSLVGSDKITVTRTAAKKKEPATIEVALTAEATGKMKFVGRQFIIPDLRKGFSATITSTEDDSYTVITDTIGDYNVLINTGLEANPPEPYEGNSELNNIKLSTKAVIRIWREKTPLNGTTIAAVLITNSSGKGRDSFAFAVGKADVAARSNVFLDTITNDMAIAEAALAEAEDDDFASIDATGDDLDGFGDLEAGSDDLLEAPATTTSDFDFSF